MPDADVCSGIGGFLGTRGGLLDVCSGLSGLSGTKCFRELVVSCGLIPCLRPSNPPCSQLQNADAFQCSPGRTCRADSLSASVKSTVLAATKCSRISMLARRTCRTAEAVPELAGFREQKAVLRVFVPKKCCFRERKGNCPEFVPGLAGFWEQEVDYWMFVPSLAGFPERSDNGKSRSG